MNQGTKLVVKDINKVLKTVNKYGFNNKVAIKALSLIDTIYDRPVSVQNCSISGVDVGIKSN